MAVTVDCSVSLPAFGSAAHLNETRIRRSSAEKPASHERPQRAGAGACPQCARRERIWYYNDGRGLLAHPEGRDGPSSEDPWTRSAPCARPSKLASRCTRFLETTTACANSSSDEGPRTRGWATGGAWRSRSGTRASSNARLRRAAGSTSSSTAAGHPPLRLGPRGAGARARDPRRT